MHHKKFLLTAISTAALALLILTLVFSGGSSAKSNSSEQRSVSGPLARLEDGIAEIRTTLPLFHRADENYVRGSQPLRGGIQTLVQLGVKTLVDLRSKYDHTDEVETAAVIAGLGYEWLPMSIWDPPTDQEAQQFVSLVTNSARGPFYVFCADGMNRTGELTAIYRIAQSGWSVEQALAETDAIGFNPYCYTLRNYVWDYARKFRPSALPLAGRRIK